MAAEILPARSGLIGVALVVRSKEGPRFVFHYPAQIKDVAHHLPRWGTELDPTTPEASDDEDEDDDLEEEDFGGFRKDFDSLQVTDQRDRARGVLADGDEHYDSDDGTQVVPWEFIDAFKAEDLASILTPASAYHKRRFELSLDPVTFVTYPMHARDDGTWMKVKKSRKQENDDLGKAEDDESGRDDVEAVLPAVAGVNVPSIPQQPPEPVHGNSFVSDNSEGYVPSGMTMFNLVLIMHPPSREINRRVDDMYEHVAKNMNKALRVAQHQSNYVWRQSELILNLKEKGKEDRTPMSAMWRSILGKSTLAVAIKGVYDAISRNEIATITLASEPQIKPVVRIPKAYFLVEPPNEHEEAMPGLWITTANRPSSSQDIDNYSLDPNFTLILLDDSDKIMAEIQKDGGELSVTLLQYLTLLDPKLSFTQISTAHKIPLEDILVLASHLIAYRLAMAVPPLHNRDVYITNPNADNHALASATPAWIAAFPLAPCLTTFLAELSCHPRAFKTFAPSKSHRVVYIQMLAWLLRGGWVTQLRTFAWIVVWPEIRYEVQYEIDRSALQKAAQEAGEDALREAMESAGSRRNIDLTTEQMAERARVTRAREKARAEWAEFQKRPQPVRSDDPSHVTREKYGDHVLRFQPVSIINPGRPSPIEGLYIEAIGKRFVEGNERRMWNKLVRYFDGREAVEMIALREGMKRKEVLALMAVFERYLFYARHW